MRDPHTPSADLQAWRHDARTAIATILNSLATLESAPQRRDFDGVRLNLDYLLALIDSLDLSAQPESTIGPPLQQALGALCSSLESSAAERGVELRFTRSENDVRLSSFETTSVARILMNLVGNALEHADSTSVTVHTSVSDGVSTQRHFLLSVADNGVGIANVAPKPQSNGSSRGHGLAIVRRLCEVLGGSLSNESPPSGGTAFEVVFPVSGVAQVARRNRPEPTAPRRPVIGAFKGPVLLLDDDPEVVLAISAKLSEYSIDTVGRATTKEALEEDLSSFQLVLIDLHLGEECGVDGARQIRSAGFDGAILAVTALPELALENRDLFDGCYDKTHGSEELVATVLSRLAATGGQSPPHFEKPPSKNCLAS